jgi:hypothetical protein
MKPAYRVMPASQSYAPARTFACRQEAVARFHVHYAVHERRPTGHWRLVLTLDAVPLVLCGK